MGATFECVLPYGKGGVRVVHGGLDIPKPDGGGATILANAAIIISFDMERRPDAPDKTTDKAPDRAVST